MAKFLLPAFRGEGGEPAPRGGRGWETFSIADLESFSKALAAPKDLQPTVFVDAIPDIWGKALLFAWSLRDQSHTLHGRSEAAFRGFLTLLALRHIRKFNVTVARVDIKDPKGVRFGLAVSRLLPDASPAAAPERQAEAKDGSRTLSPYVGWDPAWVFLLDNEVIGVSSPLTLIAPREGEDMPRAGARRLTDGYRFKDPSNDLSARDAAMVRDWVNELQTHVTQNAPDNSWRVAVTSRIHDFLKVLGEGGRHFAAACPISERRSGASNQTFHAARPRP